MGIMRETTHADYGSEHVIVENGGLQVRCSANHASDTDYMRIVLRRDGREFELVYWNIEELSKRPEKLMAVMLLIGRIFRGFTGDLTELEKANG